ncbi:hypothetical protein B0J14DRAFT_555940 [Halenospora varia]|nr:hypothetical protein B0J14DRAFT_555940 [Halenospora varia]
MSAPITNQDVAASSSSTVSEDFPKFLELFPELQLMIWERALPGPRLVKVTIKNSEDLLKTMIDESDHRIAHIKTPVMLHASHTSRTVALKVYQVSFEQELLSPVYFDECRDILKFDSLQTAFTFAHACHDSTFSNRHIPIAALETGGNEGYGYYLTEWRKSCQIGCFAQIIVTKDFPNSIFGTDLANAICEIDEAWDPPHPGIKRNLRVFYRNSVLTRKKLTLEYEDNYNKDVLILRET